MCVSVCCRFLFIVKSGKHLFLLLGSMGDKTQIVCMLKNTREKNNNNTTTAAAKLSAHIRENESYSQPNVVLFYLSLCGDYEYISKFTHERFTRAHYDIENRLDVSPFIIKHTQDKNTTIFSLSPILLLSPRISTAKRSSRFYHSFTHFHRRNVSDYVIRA